MDQPAHTMTALDTLFTSEKSSDVRSSSDFSLKSGKTSDASGTSSTTPSTNKSTVMTAPPAPSGSKWNLAPLVSGSALYGLTKQVIFNEPAAGPVNKPPLSTRAAIKALAKLAAKAPGPHAQLNCTNTGESTDSAPTNNATAGTRVLVPDDVIAMAQIQKREASCSKGATTNGDDKLSSTDSKGIHRGCNAGGAPMREDAAQMDKGAPTPGTGLADASNRAAQGEVPGFNTGKTTTGDDLADTKDDDVASPGQQEQGVDRTALKQAIRVPSKSKEGSNSNAANLTSNHDVPQFGPPVATGDMEAMPT